MLKGIFKSLELFVFCKFNYFVMFGCVCVIVVLCFLIVFYYMNVNIELFDWVKVRGYLFLFYNLKNGFFFNFLKFNYNFGFY